MTNHLNDPSGSYDFGDDADVELPNDPAFDAWVSQAAPLLNAPPATPRTEMWDAIEAAQKTSAAAQSGSISGVRPLHQRRWLWPMAIAAALLLGVGIDRVAVRRVDVPAAVQVAKQQPQQQPAPNTSRLYHLAAEQTLGQAEALLTAFRASESTRHDPEATRQLGTWGREVLSSTRLLMDSPAGDDPQLRRLLNDLELVLVQIIRTSGAPLNAGDKELIDRAMHENNLLPRIRTAVPAGVAGSASDE